MPVRRRRRTVRRRNPTAHSEAAYKAVYAAFQKAYKAQEVVKASYEGIPMVGAEATKLNGALREMDKALHCMVRAIESLD